MTETWRSFGRDRGPMRSATHSDGSVLQKEASDRNLGLTGASIWRISA
jgi:hypothetical protein